MTAAQEHSIQFRMGEERDAAAIAHYYNMANNGLSEAWWSKQAKAGEIWIDAFVRDIKTPESIAYYERCVLAEHNGEVVGLLIAFPQDKVPPAEMLAALPPSERNLLELRRLVEGSLYIAIVAVSELHRNFGVARHFVNMSMTVAESSNFKEVFGIIHESAKGWLASFLRRGFTERARIDVGDHPFYPASSNWILVTCPVASSSEAS